MPPNHAPIRLGSRRHVFNADDLRLIIPLPQLDHLTLQRISLKRFQFLTLGRPPLEF